VFSCRTLFSHQSNTIAVTTAEREVIILLNSYKHYALEADIAQKAQPSVNFVMCSPEVNQEGVNAHVL
jgi:hypothetical protein